MKTNPQPPYRHKLDHRHDNLRTRNPRLRAPGWRSLAFGLAFGVGLMGWLPPSIQAGSLYWNTTGGAVNTASGPGTWDAGISSFWTTSPAGGTLAPWVADSDAYFVTTGANNPVTLSGLVRVNSLQQATNGTATTISPTVSTDTIQIDGAAGIINGVPAGNSALTIQTAIAINTNITVNSAQAVAITGPISDGGKGYGITKIGAGTLTMNTGSSTYTGPTVIGQGTLLLNDPGAFGISALANSPITIGEAGSGLNAPNLTLTESAAAAANPFMPRSSLTINGPTVTATSAGVANLTINGTSGGSTVESFPTWTFQAGMLRGLFNANAAGNLQIMVTNVVRNPGTILDLQRNSANTQINLGGGPIASPTPGYVNVVFGNPPAMIGGGGATGTPTVSIIPWVVVAAAANDPSGTGVGYVVPATYDPVNGLRGLNHSTEMVPISLVSNPFHNAQVTSNYTLTANTTINSLHGTAGTLTLGGTTLTVSSGAVFANASYTIGASINDGFLAFGSAEGIFGVANARALTINSIITGTGGVTIGLDNLNQSSVKDIYFNGANTYSGITTIVGNSQPILQLVLGNSLALQNTTLDYNNYGAFLSFGSLTAATLGGLKGAQNLASGVNLTVGGDGDSTTYSGILSGAGSLTKTGTGALTLTGASTYSGGTTLSSGQLNVNYGGSSSTNSAIGTGTLTLLGGTLDNTSGSAVTLAPNNVQIWNGNFTFNGASSLNLGAGAVTLGGNSQVTVNANTLTVGGGISGNASLTKAGNGTLALSGNDSYQGNTLISGGTLALTGSGAISVSPGLTLVNGATFDVSGLSATFTLGGSQAFYADGTVNGSVNASTGSAIYPGTDLGYGTNTFKNNLSLAAGATANFDLGTTANGANDLIVVSGNLSLNGNTLHLKAPSTSAILDTSDYTLFTVGGTISGSFALTPTWDVQPLNFGHYQVMTVGQKVVLHYAATVVASGTGSATPSTVSRYGSTLISVTVTPGSSPVSSVVLNASPIGGASSVPLVEVGSTYVYTNTVTVGAIPGGAVTLNATITDTDTTTATVVIPLTVRIGVAVWNGASGSDSNWSDNNNWVGGVGPLSGDAVVFAGLTGLNPVMDQSFNLSSVTFSNNAGSFLVNNANGAVLTLGNGVTNNSSQPQALNTPIFLAASQTFNTAAGSLALGGVVSGNIAVLTNAGVGALMLSGSNTYAGGLTIASGTVVVANNAALGGGVLTFVGGSLSNSAGVSYALPNNVQLAGAANVVVGANDTLSLLGTISGSGSLTEVGGGTLLLPAANNYNGVTTVSGSTLAVGNNGAVGNSVLTLGNGAVLTNAASSSYTLPNVISLTGQASLQPGPAGQSFALYGAITNVGGLTLSGPGTVIMAGTATSTYSGGTVLQAGVLDVEKPGTPLGTGTITLAGGTLEANSAISVTLTNSVYALTNTTSYLVNSTPATPTLNLAGNISGPGNITVNGSPACQGTVEWSGTNSGFTGTLTINPQQVYQKFTFGSASAGFPNGSLVVALPGGYGYTETAPTFTFGTGTIWFGSLNTGGPDSAGGWNFQNNTAGTTTLAIGSLNTDNLVYANLHAGSGSFGILKVGTGLLSIAGNNPGLTGLIEVAGGTNAITTAAQTPAPVQVDDGATFSVTDIGNGLSAQVTSMVVGTNTGASLILDAAYAGGFAPINIVSGSMTVNGTCPVALPDYNGFASPGTFFPLVQYSSCSGSGNFVMAAPLPNGTLGGLINDPPNGGLLLSVAQSAGSTPTNISFTLTGGGGFTISWPADYQGWALQTNSVGLTATNAWGTVSGSLLTTSESFTVDPTQKHVFYRLALP